MLVCVHLHLLFHYCRLQPHADTRAKQIAAWKSLILEYYRMTKQAVVDVREVHTNPLFNNSNINSILFTSKVIYSLFVFSFNFTHTYISFMYFLYFICMLIYSIIYLSLTIVHKIVLSFFLYITVCTF